MKGREEREREQEILFVPVLLELLLLASPVLLRTVSLPLAAASIFSAALFLLLLPLLLFPPLFSEEEDEDGVEGVSVSFAGAVRTRRYCRISVSCTESARFRSSRRVLVASSAYEREKVREE